MFTTTCLPPTPLLHLLLLVSCFFVFNSSAAVTPNNNNKVHQQYNQTLPDNSKPDIPEPRRNPNNVTTTAPNPNGTWAGVVPFDISVNPQDVNVFVQRFCETHPHAYTCGSSLAPNYGDTDYAQEVKTRQDNGDVSVSLSVSVSVDPVARYCPCPCYADCPCCPNDCGSERAALPNLSSHDWNEHYAVTCKGPVYETNLPGTGGRRLLDPADDFIRRVLYWPMQQYLCDDSLASMLAGKVTIEYPDAQSNSLRKIDV